MATRRASLKERREQEKAPGREAITGADAGDMADAGPHRPRVQDVYSPWSIMFAADVRARVEEEKRRTGKPHYKIVDEALRAYFSMD